MATFELSAFTDEYSQDFDRQIEGMLKNDLKNMEIRGVNGKSIKDVTEDEAKELKNKLDANGLRVSSMGSPLGKIKLSDDFDAHIEELKHIIALADIFACDRIRMFSFYLPDDKTPEECRGEVMYKLGRMLDIAKASKVVLCHENEKGIYGDVAKRCLDIQREFNSEIKLVFDHANFVCCDDEPYPYAFNMLRDYIFYMHIKDATADKKMAPAGKGIGRFVESFRELNKYDRHYILTVEPHLQVFKGLDGLESAHRTKVENQYESSEEAFAAAVSAIREVLAAI